MHIVIANVQLPADEALLHYGLRVVAAAGASCSLLQVIARPEERASARDALQAQQQQAQALGLQPNLHLSLGGAAEQVVHFAHENAVDLVVIAPSKPEAFFGQLLATPSERVLANAPCAVLLARGALRPPRRVLLLHSGPQTLRTLPVFLQQAGGLLTAESEVTLLHVMSQMGASYQVSGWELAASAEQLIEQGSEEGQWLQAARVALLAQAPLNVVPKVRHGLVVDEILAEAHEGEYDLIVLGRHGSGSWQDFLIDNVAKAVTHQARVPVLVVPLPVGER
jgi:nucleotide-binding universal stress UspA family protein